MVELVDDFEANLKNVRNDGASQSTSVPQRLTPSVPQRLTPVAPLPALGVRFAPPTSTTPAIEPKESPWEVVRAAIRRQHRFTLMAAARVAAENQSHGARMLDSADGDTAALALAIQLCAGSSPPPAPPPLASTGSETGAPAVAAGGVDASAGTRGWLWARAV